MAEQAPEQEPVQALVKELGKLRCDRSWWALNDPVAYIWLCRAERRGALVPWSRDVPAA